MTKLRFEGTDWEPKEALFDNEEKQTEVTHAEALLKAEYPKRKKRRKSHKTE